MVHTHRECRIRSQPSERFGVYQDTVKVRARWGIEGVILKIPVKKFDSDIRYLISELSLLLRFLRGSRRWNGLTLSRRA